MNSEPIYQIIKLRNLIEQGVVDPVKTTRLALQNASSIASMVLTTEVLIAEKPEKKPAGGGIYASKVFFRR